MRRALTSKPTEFAKLYPAFRVTSSLARTVPQGEALSAARRVRRAGGKRDQSLRRRSARERCSFATSGAAPVTSDTSQYSRANAGKMQRPNSWPINALRAGSQTQETSIPARGAAHQARNLSQSWIARRRRKARATKPGRACLRRELYFLVLEKQGS